MHYKPFNRQPVNSGNSGYTFGAWHSRCKSSPNGATTPTSNSSHLIAAYYSFIDPRGWKAELA